MDESNEYENGYVDGLLAGRELDQSDRVYLAAISKYGRLREMIVLIEEMSELMKEITKNIRGADNGEKITGEMADVYIGLREMELMLSNSSDVELAIAEKTARLKRKVESQSGDLDEPA